MEKILTSQKISLDRYPMEASFMSKREFRDKDRKNTRKIHQEFDGIQKMLDGDVKMAEVKKKKKGGVYKSQNPVSKLSNALDQYKTERIKTENDLVDTIKKINFDKSILFREKKKILWQNHKDES